MASTSEPTRTAPRVLVALLALGALLPASACVDLHGWRKLERPWTQERLAAERVVRVHRTNGAPEVLDAPRMEGAPRVALVGERRGRTGGSVSIPLERIVSIEVSRVEPVRVLTAVLVLGLIVGTVLLLQFAPSAGAGL